jgi:hypothetical protein
MKDLKKQLEELNVLAEQLYRHFEQSSSKLTRRQLLVVQNLAFLDTNTNAVFRLIGGSTPRFVDSAEMILRSMYDLTINVDWALSSRDNKRLWRWLRDDRKTLHRQLESLVNLKIANPKLNDKNYPLQIWQKMLAKTDKELRFSSKKADVTINEKELSLFGKVKSFGSKAQALYHTMFWLFSNKTHASPTGLQKFITLPPLHVTRRYEPLSDNEGADAEKLLSTALLWYAANMYRASRYLRTPYVARARQLYESQLAKKARKF